MTRPLPLATSVTSAGRLVGVRVALPWLLHRHGLVTLLERLTPPGPPAPATSAAALGRALAPIEAVLRWLPLLPHTCLYKSLARYSVLRSAGVPACFVMGLCAGSDAPAGHAWVELEGQPWLEHLDPRLVETFRYPRGTDA